MQVGTRNTVSLDTWIHDFENTLTINVETHHHPARDLAPMQNSETLFFLHDTVTAKTRIIYSNSMREIDLIDKSSFYMYNIIFFLYV